MYEKILVLGGTGAIGGKLVKILAEKSYEVFVTSRRRLVSERKNIKYIQGDALDTGFVKKLMVYEYYAVIDFMKYYDINIFYANMNLLLNGTKQYIYLSSATVYADEDEIISETTRRLMDIYDEKEVKCPYVRNKSLQEDFLKAFDKRNWTIVRPYITYSEERLQLGNFEKEDWLYRALKGRTIILSQTVASSITTMTHGEDVALAISKLIANEKAFGEIIQIMNSQNMYWEEILSIYVKELEEFLGRAIKIMIYTKKDIFKSSFDRIHNRIFNCDKMNKIYDVDYIKNEAGLSECLRQFLKGNRKFQDINWERQGIMDRMTDEVTSLEEILSKEERRAYALARWDGYVIKEDGNSNCSEMKEWRTCLAGYAKEEWEQIESTIGRCKSVGIWAVTNWSKRIISTYEFMGKLEDISLYDSNEEKWNKWMGRVKIKSPVNIAEEKLDCLIIANVKHYNSIYEKCSLLEHEGVKVYGINSIWKNEYKDD